MHPSGFFCGEEPYGTPQSVAAVRGNRESEREESGKGEIRRLKKSGFVRVFVPEPQKPAALHEGREGFIPRWMCSIQTVGKQSLHCVL